MCIICPEHGEFWQTPSKHTNSKHGCPKCCKNGVQLTKEEFIEKAKKVHGDKYDYSKVEYKNSRTKICIICHRKYKNGIEHGEFWLTPNNLLRLHGCPFCKKSFLEMKISKILYENNIKFIQQHTFEWLKNKKHLYLDFYLPDYNIAIECQGIQHYIKTNFTKNNLSNDELNEKLQMIQFLDKIKKQLCNEHNINILYFTDVEEEIAFYGIRDIDFLIKQIKTTLKF